MAKLLEPFMAEFLQYGQALEDFLLVLNVSHAYDGSWFHIY